MKSMILLTAALALGATACNKSEPAPAAGNAAPASAAASKAAAPASKAAESKAAAPASAAASAAAAPAGDTVAADMEAAKTIYTQRCTTCHGPEGKGDGPAGAALNPKPRTFSDQAWQAKVTDAHLAKIILAGGPSVGLSPLMPPNPDLQTKPAVVAGLVKMVRGFGGK